MKRSLTLLAIAGVFLVPAGASASRFLPFSSAKKQLNRFVAMHVAPRARAAGFRVQWQVEACWRDTASRINCHLEWQSRRVGAKSLAFRCSGIWVAYYRRTTLRVRNATWACRRSTPSP